MRAAGRLAPGLTGKNRAYKRCYRSSYTAMTSVPPRLLRLVGVLPRVKVSIVFDRQEAEFKVAEPRETSQIENPKFIGAGAPTPSSELECHRRQGATLRPGRIRIPSLVGRLPAQSRVVPGRETSASRRNGYGI